MSKLKMIAAAICILGLSTACSAPKPDKVCAHMMEIMGTGEIEGAVDACVESLEEAKEREGAIKYRNSARCIMKADNMDDLLKCDG